MPALRTSNSSPKNSITVEFYMQIIRVLFIFNVYIGMHLFEAALKEYLQCGESEMYLKMSLLINL